MCIFTKPCPLFYVAPFAAVLPFIRILAWHSRLFFKIRVARGANFHNARLAPLKRVREIKGL